MTYADEKTIAAFHYVLGDIMRISELADNITKYTDSVIADKLVFSDEVIGALKAMFVKINELYEHTAECFTQRNRLLLARVDETEEEIDKARKQLISNHIRRLNEGKCQPGVKRSVHQSCGQPRTRRRPPYLHCPLDRNVRKLE